MKRYAFAIFVWICSLICLPAFGEDCSFSHALSFNFLDKKVTVNLPNETIASFDVALTNNAVNTWYQQVNESEYFGLIDTLLAFKQQHNLDDWLFYQLVRTTAQQISPKENNYNRYTLYKWFLLNKSGYMATLAIRDTQLFFYVKSDDEVFDIPFFKNRENERFVCLNFHDFGLVSTNGVALEEVSVKIHEGKQTFSYKIDQMPEFDNDAYVEKSIQFQYQNQNQRFHFKVNEQVPVLFKNYPVVDFSSYFNIPLSKETYNSLIPELKNAVKNLDQRSGVDYLMRFTRYAFAYKNDQLAFGKEKRLSPEQTLLYEYSDCDDRAALFFLLVKEIYNLPMIVLLYPEHLTIAINFDKPVGKSIRYKNKKYSICEPTPQAQDLSIGEIQPELKKVQFHIAYEYHP